MMHALVSSLATAALATAALATSALATAALAATGFAQAPQVPENPTAPAPSAPGGETIAKRSKAPELWTAQESLVFAKLQELSHQLRSGNDRQSSSWNPKLQEYAALWVGQDDPDDRNVWHGQIPAPPQRPGLLYVMPKQSLAHGRRVFCLRSDGLLAWTNNDAAGTVLAGIDAAALDEQPALGAGGKGVLRDFPRTPQTGRDGNLWQPASMVTTASRTVALVDERGQPISMTTLCCEPGPAQFVLTQALPVGRCRTTFEGNATFTGALATGLGFAIQVGQGRFWIEPNFVTTRGRSLRIVLPKGWIARMRLGPNEAAAIATLKNISSAQSQCQASGVIDTDGDGRGEFGMFGELSGKLAIRGSKQSIQPPVLSAAFGRVKVGTVSRSGYHFRMFLPGKDGTPIGEAARGGANQLPLVADLSERTWCCYAWPAVAGQSGQRAFVINQAGNVLACANEDQRYSGAGKPPEASAAFVAKGDLRAKPAYNEQGTDGQTWVVVH